VGEKTYLPRRSKKFSERTRKITSGGGRNGGRTTKEKKRKNSSPNREEAPNNKGGSEKITEIRSRKSVRRGGSFFRWETKKGKTLVRSGGKDDGFDRRGNQAGTGEYPAQLKRRRKKRRIAVIEKKMSTTSTTGRMRGLRKPEQFSSRRTKSRIRSGNGGLRREVWEGKLGTNRGEPNSIILRKGETSP